MIFTTATRALRNAIERSSIGVKTWAYHDRTGDCGISGHDIGIGGVVVVVTAGGGGVVGLGVVVGACAGLVVGWVVGTGVVVGLE